MELNIISLICLTETRTCGDVIVFVGSESVVNAQALSKNNGNRLINNIKVIKLGRKKILTVEDLDRDYPDFPNQELKLILPIPPSVNHIYQNVGRGSRRLTTEAVKYIKTAQDIAKKEIRKTGWKKDKPCVWNVMDLYFYFPDKRIRDSHNCLKLLTDCMEGLLFYDDYFLLPRIQNVQLDRDNPRLEVIYYPQIKEGDKNGNKSS